MGEATKALPRLFGSSEEEKKILNDRIDNLEVELKLSMGRYQTLEKHHIELMELHIQLLMLVILIIYIRLI